MTVIWHGKKVEEKARGWEKARVRAAAIALMNFCRVKLSVAHPSPEARRAARRVAKMKAPYTKPSALGGDGDVSKKVLNSKGRYPYLRTGHLRRGVFATHADDKPMSRVGTNVPYGKTLHFRGYPWLQMAFAAMRGKITRILKEGKIE